MTDLLTKRDADISDDGLFRWWLLRQWDETRPFVMFVGLNPSTADAETDDQTVRKWRGFSERWGYGGYVAVNVFPYRSRHPKDLAKAPLLEAVRQENVRKIGEQIRLREIVEAVVCWGNETKAPEKLRRWFPMTEDFLRNQPCEVKCFGRTKRGDPKHPLTLGYKTKLWRYE